MVTLSPFQTPLVDLDILRTLIAIADTGNFSAAGQMVGRTPSAISMQVRKAEDILGRPLFVRSSRSVSLTEDGLHLLEHARRMVALNNEVVSRFISPDVSGEVRIGAGDDFAERLLPGMLASFNCAFPSVVVEVVMENSNILLSKVETGEIDLAVVVCDAGYDDIAAERLARERLVWAAKRGGIAAQANPLPISVWEEGCSWRKAALKALDDQDMDYRIAFRSAYIGGQKAAVLADLAVAPLPETSIGGDIVEVSASRGLPAIGDYAFGMIVRNNPSKAVSIAADHLRASFASANFGSLDIAC